MTLRKRLGAVFAMALAVVVLWATPAFAHAVILQTTPGAGEILTTSPKAITLRYNEAVEADLGSVRVYDQKGNRVDTSSPAKPSADVVSVNIRSKLGDGSYVVTWRVISADSHPVQGAFAFQVGTAANATSPQVAALQTKLLNKESSDHTVGALFGIDRGVLFGGIALLLGGVAFCAIVWGPASRFRRTARIVWAGWIATFVATIGGILLQGPYGAALPLRDVFKVDVLRDVVDSRFGHLALARLVLLLLAIPVLSVLFREPPETPPARRGWTRAERRWWTPAAVLLAIGISLTITLGGHAHTGDWTAVGVPADVLHILAMSVWIGGLVVLTIAVFPGRVVAELREVAPRFSRTGFICVGVLVATGTFQGWRQVRSLDALRHTDYGQLLIIKVAIVAVMLVFAARSRQLVRWLWPEPEPEPERPGELVVAGGSDDYDRRAGDTILEPGDASDGGHGSHGGHDGRGGREDPDNGDGDDADWEMDEALELRRLRGSVFVEVLGAIAVIVVTALLVNAVPAKTALGQETFGASDVTLKSSKVWIDVATSPGIAGVNDVHVSALTPDGAPLKLAELTVTVDLPGKKIAPINVPLRNLGAGHYVSPGFDFALGGNWRVTVLARLDEINELTLVGTIGVR